jgi:hypothetical protein
MFKSIRTTAGLAAIAAVAATAAAGVASTPAAEAAHCRQYAIPRSLQIEQANDWTVVTGKKLDAFEWQASAWPEPRDYTRFGSLYLTRFDTTRAPGTTPQVEFTLTQKNGTVGIYKGEIDSDRFIVGTTRDKFNRGRKVDFWSTNPMRCA